jgi:hypothetical protein
VNGCICGRADCPKCAPGRVSGISDTLPLDAFSPFADGEAVASRIPEREDTFARAMARVEELREANNERLARRDRAEWDCFMHFACENSLLKRQA